MANELEFTKENFDKLVKQNADMAATMQGIINGCCHPDVAIRAVFTDLAPIRKSLKKHKELYGSDT